MDVIAKDKAAKDHKVFEALVKRSKEANIPTVEEANFSIEINSEKNRFTGGDMIQIDIDLKNNGNGSPRLMRDPVEDFYNIQVNKRGVTDILPPRFARGFDGSIGSSLLPKGKKLSASVILSNLFDMSLTGSYQVKVSKRFRLQGNKNPVTISSNILNIEVTSDAPLSKWNLH